MPSSRGFPLWVLNWVGFGSMWVSGQVICSGHIANNSSRQYFSNNVFKPKLVSRPCELELWNLFIFRRVLSTYRSQLEFYKHALNGSYFDGYIEGAGVGKLPKKIEHNKSAKKTKHIEQLEKKKKYHTTDTGKKNRAHVVSLKLSALPL